MAHEISTHHGNRKETEVEGSIAMPMGSSSQATFVVHILHCLLASSSPLLSSPHLSPSLPLFLSPPLTYLRKVGQDGEGDAKGDSMGE